MVKNSKEHLAKFPSSDKRLWFAGSDAEDIAPFTKELAGILKTVNLQNLQWNFLLQVKKTAENSAA